MQKIRTAGAKSGAVAVRECHGLRKKRAGWNRNDGENPVRHVLLEQTLHGSRIAGRERIPEHCQMKRVAEFDFAKLGQADRCM